MSPLVMTTTLCTETFAPVRAEQWMNAAQRGGGGGDGNALCRSLARNARWPRGVVVSPHTERIKIIIIKKKTNHHRT